MLTDFANPENDVMYDMDQKTDKEWTLGITTRPGQRAEGIREIILNQVSELDLKD